ncbi:hypothetical protein D3C72_1594830 [compost metagenome]
MPTVTSMTMLDDGGLRLRSRMERHENVPMETMIITATRAAIGMMRTRSSSTRMRNSRKAPATKVESRPRPPELTLMTDWPIMAQPPMPPMRAEAMLLVPCPMHSWLLLLPVSVMSSTICAVSSDSKRPTAASATE